jgi:hypothetical protein
LYGGVNVINKMGGRAREESWDGSKEDMIGKQAGSGRGGQTDGDGMEKELVFNDAGWETEQTEAGCGL